jgi:lipopolysaccharide transport system permease protein
MQKQTSSDNQTAYSIPKILIQPPESGFHLDLADLWRYRELLFFLAWRDIKVRYKQTALGAAWAVLHPVFTMLIFNIGFGLLAKLPSWVQEQ